MTSPCTTRRTALTRTGALAVVFGLTMAPTASVLAQDAAGLSTVRALMAGDGSVSSVERLGGGEAPAAADLPVTVAISQSPSGEATTTNYTVTNTTTSPQAVSYLDAAGKSATVQQDVALPLVAQLAVRLPASRTDVQATGARITELSDGSKELVWSMVLFGPIGAPVSDVSFTAGGTGEPLARLDVAAVQPNATPGLSATGQAANAIVNGNGILSTVANGANAGLLKLADGVSQLLAGLDKLEAGAVQLNEGIAAGADGAAQLAAGSATAKAGSGKLAAGLGQLSTGATALSAGAGKLDTGAGKILAGLDTANAGAGKLAVGSTALSTGATAAAAGAKSLSDGLALISGGLNQLGAAAGLPAALDGAKKLRFGVSHPAGTLGATDPGGLLEALGSPTNPLTVLGGLVALRSGVGGADDTTRAIDPASPNNSAIAGLELIQRGLEGALTGTAATNPRGLPGLKAGADGVPALLPGIRTLLTDTCAAATTAATPTANLAERCNAALVSTPSRTATFDILQGTAAGVAGGVDSVIASSGASLGGVTRIQTGLLGASAGLDRLVAGVTLIRAGVSSGSAANPGLVEGLDALVAGLTSAVTGVTQLATGAGTAAAGSVALADGNAKLAAGASQIAAGNTSLASGTGQLYTGSQQLRAGTGALSAGATKLAAGAGSAATGAGALDAGLGKIADGQQKVADGLPRAVDGSGQIADGLGTVIVGETAVGKGIGDVRTQAVAVLNSQFTQGTTLARQQLAGLDAAAELIGTTEGAATTTYVLTQSQDDVNATLASSSSEGSNTGRNIGLAAGGALLLLGGIAGGFLSGRRAGAGV